VIAHAAGNTGTQMGGWFRKEIKTTADLAGLKFRIAGITGEILQKIGVAPQQLAGGDVYRRLKKAPSTPPNGLVLTTMKARSAEGRQVLLLPRLLGGRTDAPRDDQSQDWNSLPKYYQTVLANAAAHANIWMSARYDLVNPAALQRLVATGTQLRPFSNEIMEACLKATNELWTEISAKNADFKKSIEAMQAYRNDQYLWWQVAEYTNDSFMIRSRSKS
jgi:TRAP-type mannitol/chloroaromatic compound transport system substrate-binding protein